MRMHRNQQDSLLSTNRSPLRLAYLVSHPIQYQAPLLRLIAQEPDIELAVMFGSDFSLSGYKDEGFGVEIKWDIPLLEGYRSEFLRPWRDKRSISFASPVSRGIFRRLQNADGSPAFDALWIHGYASINALQAMLAAKALGIPVLLRSDSSLGDRERSPLKLAAKDLFFRALESLTDGILTAGTANAAYWSHYFGDRVPQFLLPYAIDNDWFAARTSAATAQQPALREELGIEPGRQVILFASKLQTRKHADHLVEAYRAFLANRSPEGAPYLVIVGDGEERGNLEALVRHYGLAGVRLVGFRNQSELPRFFELADVFVLPARHEPWGLIVNESMACGCPVIVSTDVGAYPDLVTDGVEGCIYPVGDIAALTHAMDRVFATADTPKRMGEAARRRIASWSFEQNIAGLRQALATVTHKLRA